MTTKLIKNQKERSKRVILVYFKGICREGKFPTYHKLTRHTTKSTKYSQLRSIPYFCKALLSHYSKTNRNLSGVMQKQNHTSARVSDDTSSPARVSDDIGNPTCVSNDISKPIRL